MRKIESDLIENKIDVVQGFLLARGKASGELREFIDKELNGYIIGDENDLPSYRKFECQIVLDYQTPWGEVHREVELDATKLNEALSFSLNYVPIVDGLSFLQLNIKSLKTGIAIKPFNNYVIDLFRKYVTTNHPDSVIIGGGHKMSVTQLQSVLDNAKIRLIKMIQDQLSNANESILPKNISMKSQDIKIFVSYSWENELENKKVISFVDFLRKNGYDARMDKLQSQIETTINLKKMMYDGIYNSDKVIIVLSEKYKLKADKLEDGVGEEIKIIQEDVAKHPNKYILVSFAPLNKDIVSKILPNALIDREILDLKKDQDDNNFSILFSKLNNTQLIEFADISNNTPIVETIKIEPFKL